jgi:RNA polymerase sigma-54 factor
MKQTLQLKLSQHLTLTPQLQQSIRLLQLSTLELNQELEKFLAENPLLEREDADAPAPAAPTQMNGRSATTLEPSAGTPRRREPGAGRYGTYSRELDRSQSGSNAGARGDSDENDYSQVAAIPQPQSICTSSSLSRSWRRAIGTWWRF